MLGGTINGVYAFQGVTRISDLVIGTQPVMISTVDGSLAYFNLAPAGTNLPPDGVIIEQGLNRYPADSVTIGGMGGLEISCNGLASNGAKVIIPPNLEGWTSPQGAINGPCILDAPENP